MVTPSCRRFIKDCRSDEVATSSLLQSLDSFYSSIGASRVSSVFAPHRVNTITNPRVEEFTRCNAKTEESQRVQS